MQNAPATLPVYRLAPQDSSAQRLRTLARQIFGLPDNLAIRETPDGIAVRDGARTVELARASGAVWAADEAQLWNPALKPQLPGEREAAQRAREFLDKNSLLPKLEAPFSVGRPVVGGTHYAVLQGGRREDRQLDVQVIYPVMVGSYPVIGGGGDLTVTLGNGGAVIGLQGGWRGVTSAFEVKLVEQAKVEAQFKELTSKLRIESVRRWIAYYAAPSFTRQDFLYPVYVFSAVAIIDNERVPMRNIILAASEFGPPIEAGEPQPPRPRVQPGATPAPIQAPADTTRRGANTLQASSFEAGTSWIGLSGGLAGSQANAQGFVNEWAAAGWTIDFNWGDANAWESDWRRNDDTWVDDADFVFYTGHANMNGWVLSNPDDGFLHFNEVGAAPATPGDLWGSNDLEWVTIAACGPLQDAILSPGGGNVLTRWDGAFDGLHILLGYGAVTFDNTDEGRKLAQYAKGGSTLINAWFRAAREIQPATNGFPAPDGPVVWVGAMWVGRSGADPVNDHAWGYGSVSADPTSPTFLAAMWTTC